MLKGHVKWFDMDRGYGIITSMDGVDVFLPYSATVGQMARFPEAGQKVLFDLVESSHNFMHATGGLRARAVWAED